MKKYINNIAIIILSLVAANFSACDKDNNVDTTQPTISDAGNLTCPPNCYECFRGETIEFCYTFSDDVELGNFNIEIHSNFDHHTHSTSSADCDHHDDEENEEHDTTNAWVYNQDFSIPSGLTSYTPNISIGIPLDIATGTYHFMIRLTDKVGWQQLKSIEIIVVE